MSWTAGILAANGLASIAGNIVGGILGSSSAARTQAALMSAAEQAQWITQETQRYVQQLYQPYIQSGTNALAVAQARMFSPTERKARLAEQRLELTAKIERLSKPFTHRDVAVPEGPRGSERLVALFNQMEAKRKRDLADARADLQAFDKLNQASAAIYEQQDLEYEKRTSRINNTLDTIAKLADLPTSLAEIRDRLPNDPVYQFRLAEGERAINRAAAARGKFFSGAAIEELGDFSAKLTGLETDAFIQRQVASLGAATTGLGSLLAEQQQFATQPLSLAALGQGATTSLGAVAAGLSQQQAQAAAAAGQAVATGEQLKTQAQVGAIQGVSQTLGSLSGIAALSGVLSPSSTAGSRTEPTTTPPPTTF